MKLMNNNNVPQVRFKGFTDAWEQRKLGDEAIEILAGGDIDKSKSVENGKYPIYANALTDDGIVGYYNDFFRVKAPAVTVTGRGDVGHAQARIVDFTPVVRLLAIRSTHDCYFLENAINNHKVLVESTGVPQLTVPQLSAYNISFPNNIEEEKKIGQYLQRLDHLITLHQRKCETLKKLKKSMLQKMFPKNGSQYPEIRFAGFTDAWEQREFSEITFCAGEKNKNDLPLEPYAITNEHGFIAQKEAHDDFGYMQDVDRTMYIIVKPNSFAYNPARINVGSLGYYEGTENVIVSSLYEVFQTVDDVDDKFLKHWFKTKDFMDWIARLQEGSVRQYFYYDKLCECKMSMPTIEEQLRIGKYFDNLDHLITLHQRKLETLKKLKKSMLQKMFI